MRKFPALAFLSAAAVLLSGCGSSGVFNRDRPDEMAVQRQAPLVVPPDFSLTPPQPGTPRPMDGTSQQRALDAMFGGPAERSDIEAGALENIGAAAPSIRSTVGDENTKSVAKGAVTRDILAAPQGDGQNARALIPG